MAGETVLIVEDTPANMELMRDVLTVAGFTVLEATSAEEGIKMAGSERPDVILMDVGLPGIDGLEAARKLKTDPKTSDIPVVCVTSNAMKGDEERALAAGCAAYLTKPINTRTLAAEVKRLISGGGSTCS